MAKFLPNSIFALLLWRIVIATLIFITIIFAITYIQIDKTLIELRDRTLEQDASDIASYLEKTEEGSIFLDIPMQVRDFYAKSGKLRQYIVRDSQNKIIFTSPVTFPDLYPQQITDNALFDFIGPQGTSFLGIEKKYNFDNQTYIIQVAQSYDIAESFSNKLTSQFLGSVLLIALPFLVILIFVIYFSLLRSFKPLVKASKEAKLISFENLENRIDEEALPSEIQPLVRAVNYALERLEKGIKTQQEFTANVAHELKTPLTIFKSRVEELGTSLYTKKLEQDIQEMLNAINQMLDLSKLDFPEAIEMKDFDIGKVLREVCTDLWPLFLKDKRNLNIKNIEEKVIVHGNRDLIYRAILNILNNALIHSPKETPVDVNMSHNEDMLEISIRDYGQEISSKDKDKIFQRFHRSDKEKFKLGSGLGLSIVSRTMALHNGRIILENPIESNGNIFILTFFIKQ